MIHEFGAIWKALLEMEIHQEASMLEVVDDRFFSKFLDIFYFVEITWDWWTVTMARYNLRKNIPVWQGSYYKMAWHSQD